MVLAVSLLFCELFFKIFQSHFLTFFPSLGDTSSSLRPRQLYRFTRWKLYRYYSMCQWCLLQLNIWFLRVGRICSTSGYRTSKTLLRFGPNFCTPVSSGGPCTSNCNALADCGPFAAAGNLTCPLNVCCSQVCIFVDLHLLSAHCDIYYSSVSVVPLKVGIVLYYVVSIVH